MLGEMYSAGQDAIYGETVENMLGFKGHTDPSRYCLGLPGNAVSSNYS